ncbi:MAG: DNA polymerase III subunit alpha [Bacteroidetes bacterium]|nr:DNA polymerase III subunit alpha [Bacteroidota bacterium]
MFLIFDTETTGLPKNYNAPLSDSDNWPRMVQIAWQLHDKSGALLHHNSIIIKPEGYTIPFNAAQIHGISTERALNEGKNLKEVLLQFSEIITQTSYLCGHNIGFDLSIIGAEFIRCGLPDFFQNKKIIDTKNDETTAFCAIPGGKGGKFKWPTLTELYKKVFNTSFQEAHNAAFDVQATSRVFFQLLKLNIIKVNEIAGAQINYQDVDLSELLQHEKSLKPKTDTEEKKATIKITENQNLVHSFSHLRNHSQFSVLQSVSDINDLVKKAAHYNMPALALADHGNMYGSFLFWQAIDKQNKEIKKHNEQIESGQLSGSSKPFIKCIIGCELNICSNHLDRTKQDNGYQIPVFAKNKIGYQNLSKLSSIGFIDGMYYVPRISKEILTQHAEGLIVTTGGLFGEIPSLILNVGEAQAEKAFLWYLNFFGEDFYVELNRHGLPDEDHVNKILLGFAKKHNVRYFAANNNYYINKENAYSRDILVSVKEGLNFSDEKELNELKNNSRFSRYFLPNNQFYFKSPAEMISSFADLPEAIECVNDIVEKIESFKLGRDVLLPVFQVPEDFKNACDKALSESEQALQGQNLYLRHLTFEGAKKRYQNLTNDIQERINFELETMARMGFPGYFLIVSDFTTKARELGVSVGPGRGSAAGSVVAYCLGITNIDPIKYDLLFERFLNPDRISMPDIDIDFDDEGRDKVIQYVVEKYGQNQVAQIITYGTMGGKSAIRDCARVLNLPLPEANKLAKSFPDSLEADLKSLLDPAGISKKYLEKIKDRKEIVEQSNNFRKILEQNNEESIILKQAYELEGCVRNTGVHACGIIITPDELTKFVPVTKPKDGNMLLTQFDNSVAENAGLLKMDFLGLKTLTIIKDTIAAIKENKGIEIDIDAIDLNDKKMLELFQRGETNGIFQFESPGMQKYLKDLKPDSFTDLIAMNALYRPGPIAYIPSYIARKHGREKVSFDLQGMDEFLSETYGITVYQEQVMRLSQKLANFTKGDADTLRKAMGKKQKDVLDKMKGKYLEGCAKNNHNLTTAEKVWKDWEAFASYAFNKSHSTCYAYLAAQTGYLKAHYPSEYMASVLNHSNGIDKISFFMEECKRMKIKVLGPDVNEAFAKFSVNKNGDIRFGMASIKGVGENTINNIITERNKNGNFVSIFDFAKRLESKSLNKKSIEGLAYAGAFDTFKNITRSMFFIQDTKDKLTLIDKMSRYNAQINTGADSLQANLFGTDDSADIQEPTLPQNIENWSELQQLNYEKEVVGLFISGHPLDPYQLIIQNRCTANCSQLKSELDAFRTKEVTFAGIITGVVNLTSKNGNPYCRLTIEDYFSSLELSLFGKDYVEFGKYAIPGVFVFIKAKVQERYNQPGSYELKITKIELLEEVNKKAFNSLKIKLDLKYLTPDVISSLIDIMNTNAGNASVEFIVEDLEERQSVKLYSKKNKITINDELINSLKKFNDLKFELS